MLAYHWHISNRKPAMTTERNIIAHHVVDSKTGDVIKKYEGGNKRVVASRFAERKNQEYGAHRYSVRPIFSA